MHQKQPPAKMAFFVSAAVGSAARQIIVLARKTMANSEANNFFVIRHVFIR